MIENPGFNNTLAPYEVHPNTNNDIGGWGSVYAAKSQFDTGRIDPILNF